MQTVIGLMEFNSSVEVVPLNDGTSYVKNIFRGLTYGIYMSGNAPNQLNNSFVTKIARTNFIDNTYAIYLNAISNPIVIEDSIKVALVADPIIVNNGFPLNPANKSYGIYLTGCQNYKVQDNQVYSSKTPTTADLFGQTRNTYGILVSNGHTANEKIRRNTFTQLRYAAVADGQNGVAGGNAGLLFQCNNFVKSEKYDLWLTGYQFTFGGTTYTINGVIPNQGMLNDPNQNLEPFASHNTFQQYSVSLPQFQLIRNNLSSSYTYFYSTIASNLKPLRVSSTYPISNVSGGVTSPCAYNIIPGDYTPTMAKKEVEDIFTLQNAQDKKEKWWIQQLTNQHDITNLLIDISENPIASAEVIKACIPQLKNETNYDAVIAILSKQGGADVDLPSLLKSADIALKFKDWQMLKTTSEGQTSPYALWQGQLSARLASIEDWVKYKYDGLIERGDFKAAFALLSDFKDIDNIALFEAEQKMTLGSLQEKEDVIRQLQLSNKPLMKHLASYYIAAPKKDENALQSLLQYSDMASFKAIGTLAMLQDTIYTPYLPDPNEESESILINNIDDWKKVKTISGIKIDISPVPADNFLSINIVVEEAQDFTISIYSMEGKELFSKKVKNDSKTSLSINTEEYASASYILKVVGKDNNQEAHNFSINHN